MADLMQQLLSLLQTGWAGCRHPQHPGQPQAHPAAELAWLRAGTLQNLVSVLPIVIPPGPCEATGASQQGPDHPSSLQHALCVAAAACRTAILHIREPGQVLAECAKYAQAPYADVPIPPFPPADLVFSNWDRCSP